MRDLINIVENVMVDEIEQTDWELTNSIINGAVRYVNKKMANVFGNLTSNIIIYVMPFSRTMAFYDIKNKKMCGYAVIEHDLTTKSYSVNEIGLRKAYRGKGLGYKFYLLLLSKNIVLKSDKAQTVDGIKIWKRLMQEPGIKVTGYDENNKPLKDANDAWNRWSYYLIEKSVKNKKLKENIMVDEILNIPSHDLDVRVVYNKCNKMKPRTLFGSYKNVTAFFIQDGKRLYFIMKNSEGTPVGAAILVKWKDGWFVNEIGVLHRYEGYGYNFYKLLLSKGFSLISGATQTPNGKKVWQKLMKDDDVSVKTVRMINGADKLGKDDKLVPDKIDDPWNDDDVYLMANSKQITEDFGKSHEVKSGLNYVVKFPLKIFGMIGDVVVSIGEDEDERVFLFSHHRKALGYANGNVMKISIDDEKFSVLDISDIALFKNSRGKGIGLGFYKMLLENDYKIMSNETQTSSGKKLWKKLIGLPSVGVTSVEHIKENKYKHIDLVADDPWSKPNVRLIVQAGNHEITEEGDLRVAVIQPQPPELSRCTTISCNAILSYFKRPLITSAASVPTTMADSLELLKKRGLNVMPDYTSPEKHMSVKMFANFHRTGVFYIGTQGHALALVDGELYDAENKGIDGRIIVGVAEILR